MNLAEIAPGVYRIDLRISNCYLVAEDSGLTLIDAGVKNSFIPLVEAIQSLGRSPQELKTILLTHADIDHVGAAPALRDQFGAQIWSGDVAAQALAEGHSSRPANRGVAASLTEWFETRFGNMQMEVDRILAEGEQLPILDGLQVIATPGHTPCHLSYYAPRPKLLFAGDSVSTRPGRVTYNRVKLFNWDQEQMRASVHRQATLHPEIVCSGHGPVIYGASKKFPVSSARHNLEKRDNIE